jgi:DNA-binding beta-propeller fold protein YncE
VTPIDLATRTPGKPIHVRGSTFAAIAITPDGKTAYVACGNAVTPIDLATGTPGVPPWGFVTGKIEPGESPADAARPRS